MAYGILYYNEFTSSKFQKLVRIEILQNEFAGLSIEKKIGATLHLGDSGDERYVPIKKTTATINITSETNQEFNQFFTSSDKEFQIKIFRGGVLIWSGFLESDSYSEPYYTDRNYNVSLTARDNLGTLTDIKYLDDLGVRYDGLEKASIIIDRCLLKTGLDLDVSDQIDIYSDGMSELLTTTEQEYINQTGFVNDKGETYSCLAVIESILIGHGAQIRQANGRWVIRELGNFFGVNQETKAVQSQPLLINVSGDVLLVDDTQYLDIGGDGYNWLNSDSGLTFIEAWKQFTLEQDTRVPSSFFSKFPQGPSSYTYVGPEINRYTLNNWNMNGFNVNYREGFTNAFIDPIGVVGWNIDTDIPVKQTNLNLLIQLDYTNGSSFFYGTPVTESPVIDVLISDGGQTQILTDSGWVVFAGQSKELRFDNIVLNTNSNTQVSVVTDGIPFDGDIKIVLHYETAQVFTVSDIVYSFRADNLIKRITSSIDQDNNLTPSNIELEIGEVPIEPNSTQTYLGGLFDSSGVVLENWHRACCPASIYPLLEVVARGYNTLYKQSAWQINGSITWDFDMFTSVNESGHIMLLNSIDWQMFNDEATCEFIEVFEYDDSIDIIEESQITDGSTRDFFQVNDNVDFLAFTIDAGSPKRISGLPDENDPTNSYIILDDPAKTESKRLSWSNFISALENTLNSFLRKDQNLADLDNVSTSQTNLDVYGKSASDARYVNIDGNETIEDTKTFSELVGLAKGWVISTFISGFAGQGARLQKDLSGKVELEVDRIKVREVFTAYETQIGQIRGIDGDLIVSSSEKVEVVIEEELNILVEDGVELLVDTAINLEI